MGNKKISFIICGTRVNAVGWEDLLLFDDGVPEDLFKIKNQGVGGVQDSVYFVVKIYKEYTQVTLALNPKAISCSDGNRDGMLKIAIIIPNGYKINVNGHTVTPLNVLLDLFQLMKETVLISVSGDRERYKFNGKYPDQNEFQKILDQYELIPQKKVKFSMSEDDSAQTGIIELSEEKMDLFFRDFYYPELSRYKEVAVVSQAAAVENINSINKIDGLEIPRSVKYEIYLNGQNITTKLKTSYGYTYDNGKELSLDLLQLAGYGDKAWYEEEKIKFSINGLIDGSNRDSRIKLSEDKEIVEIHFSPKEIRKEYSIVVQDNNDINVEEIIKLYVNNNLQPIEGGTFILVGKNNINPKIKVISLDDEFTVSSEFDYYAHKLYVTLRKKEKPKKTEQKTFDESNQSEKVSSLTKKECLKIKIQISDKKDIQDIKKAVKVSFISGEKNDDNLQVVLNLSLNFKPFNAKTGYVSDFTLPSKYRGEYKLELVTDRVKFKPDNEKDCIFTLSENTIIKIKDNQTEELKWYFKIRPVEKRWIRLGILFSMIMMVLASIITYYITKNVVTDKKQKEVIEGGTYESSTEEIQGGGAVIAVEGNANSYPIPDYGNDADIKFDSLEYFFNKRKEQGQTEDDEFKRLKAYVKLIDILKQKEKRTVKNIRKTFESDSTWFYKIHADMIRSLWINGSEVEKINKKLKEITNFNSFKDLEESANVSSTSTYGIKESEKPGYNNNEEER